MVNKRRRRRLATATSPTNAQSDSPLAFTLYPNFPSPTVAGPSNTFALPQSAVFFINSSPFLFCNRRPATPLPPQSLLPKSELCMLFFLFSFFLNFWCYSLLFSAILFACIFIGCREGCLFRKLFGTAISCRLFFATPLFVLRPQGNLVCLLCTTQKLNFQLCSFFPVTDSAHRYPIVNGCKLLDPFTRSSRGYSGSWLNNSCATGLHSQQVPYPATGNWRFGSAHSFSLSRSYVSHAAQERKSKRTLLYLTALVVAMVGCTYAAVPLYRTFCQATGYGGTVQRKEVKFDHFVVSYLLLSFKDDVYVVL